MILHLISDDKFTDYAIDHFSEIDNTSDFLLVSDSLNFELKNIKNKEKVIVLYANTKVYSSFLETINKYSAVVTHGLFFTWQEKIILSLSENVKVAWAFWGAEIYGRPQFNKLFLAPKTKWLHTKRQFKKIIQGRAFKEDHFFALNKTYKRIDYCLTDVHEDFEFIKKHMGLPMKELWYNYYSIEETLGTLKSERIHGNNILVGNSCSIENNHSDIFNKLKKIDTQDRKIIVPLSYGAVWLQKRVVKKGESTFGKSFQPLLTFMEKEEYNRFLTSCSIVVMNHYRPQALGNIITTLWLGAKVYMSNKSHLYDYLKRLGIIVLSIEGDLLSSNKTALESLCIEDVENNKRILMQEYGKRNMTKKIKQLITTLNN